MTVTRTLPLVLLVLAACATTQERRAAPPLTEEARAMLERTLSRPEDSGLVVDLHAMEELGLASKEDSLRDTVRLLQALLPFALDEMDSDEERQALARLVVAASVLREWSEWPRLRGYALAVPNLAGGKGPAPKDMVLVLAVAQDEGQNRDLLTGVLSLARAVLAEEHGEDITLELRGTDGCLVSPGDTQTPPLCIRAGNGYFLFGSQDSMGAFSALSPEVRKADQPATLVRARVNAGRQGSGELLVHGKEALAVEVDLASESPVMLARAEQAVSEFLGEYDQRRARQRELLTTALAQLQRDVANDPQAPQHMKDVAAQLSVDKVMDPKGYWQSIRQSIKSERSAGRYRASLVVPPAAVNELRELMESGGGGAASSVGVLAAVAIPNFMKFQCRAKQSEAKANLKALFVAQRAHVAEKDAWGTSFQAIGFAPEPGTRYTYCMGQDCLACTHKECQPAQGPETPCAGMSGVGKTLEDGFQACAFANLDSDADFDVWLVDDSGRPQQGQNDCE